MFMEPMVIFRGVEFTVGRFGLHVAVSRLHSTEPNIISRYHVRCTAFASIFAICNVNRVRSMSIFSFVESSEQLMRNECRNVVNKMQYRFIVNKLIFEPIKSKRISSCSHYYRAKVKYLYKGFNSQWLSTLAQWTGCDQLFIHLA